MESYWKYPDTFTGFIPDLSTLWLNEYVKFVDMRGNVVQNQQGIEKIPFDVAVNSVVCLEDGILAFHPHGLKGFGFDGQLGRKKPNWLLHEYHAQSFTYFV
ncbi:unnamed protein product [Dibothriocephalus latus]|uniref:Uncharacterized protein n=1 Tax=Dibothriocephalus latus TaxID=60516 RepID=A0A3P7M6H5_DIBLA|nr:unnamed protein product [Dibothriocephalus latus]